MMCASKGFASVSVQEEKALDPQCPKWRLQQSSLPGRSAVGRSQSHSLESVTNDFFLFFNMQTLLTTKRRHHFANSRLPWLGELLSIEIDCRQASMKFNFTLLQAKFFQSYSKRYQLSSSFDDAPAPRARAHGSFRKERQ